MRSAILPRIWLRRAAVGLSTIAIALAAAPAAVGLPPDNDSYTTPELLGPPDYDTDTNQEATTQPGEPLLHGGAKSPKCNVEFNHTIWYRINGTGNPVTVLTEAGVGSYFSGSVAYYQTDTNTPSLLNLVGCGWHEYTYDTQAGAGYLVQVGPSFCDTDLCDRTNYNRGAFRIESLLAPTNDDRVHAAALPDRKATVMDTRGATLEPGEHHTYPGPVGPLSYGKTVWNRYTAPGPGFLHVTLTGPSNGVVAVYAGAMPTPLRAARPAYPSTTATLDLPVTKGEYLIQSGDIGAYGGKLELTAAFSENLDVDGDKSNRPQDCDDANAAIHPGALDVPENGIDEDCSGADAIDFDRDRDGYLRPQDCNDADAAVNPGATDVLDNGIDEDCSGADAIDYDRDRDGFTRPTDCDDSRADVHPGAKDVPRDGRDQDCTGSDADYPLLLSGVAGFFRYDAVATRFTGLMVRRPAAGSTITMLCKGRGCTFGRRTRRVAREVQRLSVLTAVKRARLRPGAVFELRVTKPGHIGIVVRWTMRKSRSPQRADLCLRPDARRPARCS
jgi:hypothetical protein